MSRVLVGDAAGAREYSGEVGVVEAFVRLVRPALEALQRARPVDVHQGEEGPAIAFGWAMTCRGSMSRLPTRTLRSRSASLSARGRARRARVRRTQKAISPPDAPGEANCSALSWSVERRAVTEPAEPSERDLRHVARELPVARARAPRVPARSALPSTELATAARPRTGTSQLAAHAREPRRTHRARGEHLSPGGASARPLRLPRSSPCHHVRIAGSTDGDRRTATFFDMIIYSRGFRSIRNWAAPRAGAARPRPPNFSPQKNRIGHEEVVRVEIRELTESAAKSGTQRENGASGTVEFNPANTLGNSRPRSGSSNQT